MVEIIFPDYTPIVPNNMYQGSYRGPSLRDPPKFEILTIARFTEPSEDQVVKYICEKAKAYLGLGFKEKADTQTPLPAIDTLIRSFDSSIILALEREDKGLLDFLRRHSPVPEESYHYLQLGHGVCEESLLGVSLLDNTQGEVYNPAFNVRIRTQEGRLYDRKVIDFLLEHRTSFSETFRCSAQIYPEELMQRLVNLLYDNLPSPQHLDALSDISSSILEEAAISAIVDLHEREQEDADEEEEPVPKRKIDQN